MRSTNKKASKPFIEIYSFLVGVTLVLALLRPLGLVIVPAITYQVPPLSNKILNYKYLHDDAPLTDNKFQGNEETLLSFKKLWHTYQNDHSYIGEDFTNGRMLTDMFPEYKHPIIITYTGDQKGGNENKSVIYSRDSKIILKSYIIAKGEQLYVDANFLNSYLEPADSKNFTQALSEKGLSLKSFIAIEIAHGNYAYNNTDPNYFTIFNYGNKIREELDSGVFDNIIQRENNTFEIIDKNDKELPLISGFKVIHFHTILSFNSDGTFSLARYANKILYYQAKYYPGSKFKTMRGATGKLEDLNYHDHFISPDINS